MFAKTVFKAYQVIEVLVKLARARGEPRSIRTPLIDCCAINCRARDSGLEFAGRLLDQLIFLNKIELDFSRPRKPSNNAYIEIVNARLRQECLSVSWLLSMADARQWISEWRDDYNEQRPYSSLGNLAPSQFANQSNSARKAA